MNESSPPDVAWSDASSRRVWRRGLWVGVGWVGIGLVLLVAFVTYATLEGDHADGLRATGTKVTGTVLADSTESARCTQVPLPVRFELAGATYDEKLHIDGCGGEGSYTKGEPITLYVDPHHPSNLVSDQSDNENVFAVLGAIVALILGVAFPFAALVRWWRSWRVRRVLRAAPWERRDGRVVRVRDAWAGDRFVLALDPDFAPELLEPPWTPFALRWVRPIGPIHDHLVLATASNGQAVAAVDSGSRAVRVVPVRRDRTRRGAIALLGTPHDAGTAEL